MSTSTLTRDIIAPPVLASPILIEAQEQFLKSHEKLQAELNKYSSSDTCIISGYGASLTVKNDVLVIDPGLITGQKEESIKVYPGRASVKNIIVTSKRAKITVSAMEFCKQEKISIVVLDIRGKVIQTLTREKSSIELRRKQYLLSDNRQLEIAKEIITLKGEGQLNTLYSLTSDETRIDSMSNMIKGIASVSTISDLRLLEGRIAHVYFSAFSSWGVSFDRVSVSKVAPHWLTFGERHSIRTNKQATTVGNALLNYGYAILESQCRIALQSLGLALEIGVMHADLENRDSLVYDLMEVFRSQVDKAIYEFVRTRTFSMGDFLKSKDGAVVFHPTLRKLIVAFLNSRLSQKDVLLSAKMLRERIEKE